MKSNGRARAETMISNSMEAPTSLPFAALLPLGWLPFTAAIILLIFNVSMNGVLILPFISLDSAGTWGLALLVVAGASVLLISTLGLLVARGRAFARRWLVGLSIVYALAALTIGAIHLVTGSGAPAIFVITSLSFSCAAAAGWMLGTSKARDFADFYAELWRFCRARSR